MANSYNNQKNNRRPENPNLMTALLTSELIKPLAAKTKVKLSEQEKEMIANILPSLREDALICERALNQAVNRRLNLMGLKADKLKDNAEAFDVADDEDIEKKKAGYSVLTASLNLQVSQQLKTYSRFASTCAEVLEDAFKTGEISMLNAERVVRYIDMLSQEIVRHALNNEPLNTYNRLKESIEKGNNTKTPQKKRTEKPLERPYIRRDDYINFARSLDSRFQNSAYAIARRLVMKYTDERTLEELDGFLAVNAITGKSVDIPLIKGVEREIDPATGVQLLTPKGVIELVEKMGAMPINNGVAEIVSKDGNKKRVQTFNFLMTEADTELFSNALANIKKKAEVNFQKTRGQELIENIIKSNKWEIKGHNDLERLADAYGQFLNIGNGEIRRSKMGLARLVEDLSKNDPNGLGEKHLDYIEMRTLWQSAKQLIINSAVNVSFDTDLFVDETNVNRFPYTSKDGDEVNPFANIQPGRLITMITDSDLTSVRANSLPFSLLDTDSGKGRELLERAEKIIEESEAVSKNARAELEPYISQTSDEVAEKLSNAISGQRMNLDKTGWLKDADKKDRRKLLKDTLMRAAEAIALESDDTIRQTLKNISSVESSVVPRPEENEEPRKIKHIDGCEVIDLPPVRHMTPASRFALLTNMYVSSEIDKAVPEGRQVYYNDLEERRYHNLIAGYGEACLSDRFSLVNSKFIGDAETAFEEIKWFASELTKARKQLGQEAGVSKAQEILDEGEMIVGADFINDYRKSFEQTQDAYRLCYKETDDSGKQLLRVYGEKGKEYGEAIVRKLAENILLDADMKEAAQDAKEKNLEDMSPATRYVVSNIAIACIETTLEKIEKDTRYTLCKNSTANEWNQAKDMVKAANNCDALMKGTMPVFLQDEINKYLLENIPLAKESQELSRVIGVTENSDKAIEKLATLLKNKRINQEQKLNFTDTMFDPEVNTECVNDLRELMLIWDDDNASREQGLEILTRIETNNPESFDVCEKIRNVFEDETVKYGTAPYNEAVNLIDELEFMSPYAKVNPNLNFDHLMEQEALWGAKKRTELAEKAVLTVEGKGLSPEDQILLNTAMIKAFDIETVMAKKLNELAIRAGDKTMSEEETLKTLREATIEVRKGLSDSCIGLCLEELAKLGVKSLEPVKTSMPMGLLVKTVPNFDRGVGKVFADENQQNEEKARGTGVEAKNPIDLRNKHLAKFGNIKYSNGPSNPLNLNGVTKEFWGLKIEKEKDIWESTFLTKELAKSTQTDMTKAFKQAVDLLKSPDKRDKVAGAEAYREIVKKVTSKGGR